MSGSTAVKSSQEALCGDGCVGPILDGITHAWIHRVSGLRQELGRMTLLQNQRLLSLEVEGSAWLWDPSP